MYIPNENPTRQGDWVCPNNPYVHCNSGHLWMIPVEEWHKIKGVSQSMINATKIYKESERKRLENVKRDSV